MPPITTVIVDDEPLARRGLKTLVERHPEFAVVATCADGREAIARIAGLKPDLVLLDIQMPEVTGFDVLERLPPDVLPVVIFVTAYDEHAIRAFEVRALDYLLKPVSQKRFDEALERAAARLRDRRLAEYGATLLAAVSDIQQERGAPAVTPGAERHLERIMVRTGDGFQFVNVADIDWIEGADYYVTLHACGKEFLYRESLKHLEGRLDPARFVRIHQSAIVNLAKVREIRRTLRGNYQVMLDGGRKLPVSRRRRKELIDLGVSRFGLKPDARPGHR
jgi:two-component system LytT family response regulator